MSETLNWKRDIADDLPAPRDDEPSSLRQDIADELADHLQSSLVRELHCTPEESSAKQHVLDRFGDPRRVARQLWLDAMKGKIMSQRVNLVISSLMTAACLGALGLMTVMLRDSREVNAAILARLAALATPQPAPTPAAAPVQDAADTSKSMDWVRPKFKLVLGEKGGLAAVGFKVRLQAGQGGVVLGETEKNGVIYPGMVEETTSTEGIVDLGLFRFGSYQLSATSPWGETTTREIGLRPGQVPIREIVCPAAAPDQADVTFNVEWPDDLKDRGLWLVCNFSPGVRRVGTESWSMGIASLNDGHTLGFLMGYPQSASALIINSDGKIAIRRTKLSQSQNAQTGQFEQTIDFVRPSRFDDQVQLPALQLSIRTFMVVESKDEISSRSIPVLAHGGLWSGMGGMGGGFMFGGMGGAGGGMGMMNVADEGRTTATQDGDSLSFEPKPGQLNHWKVKISDDVLDRVRVKLKMIPDPAADDAPAGDEQADDSSN